MSHENDLSHRQEREQKKAEHAHSTPGKSLSSLNPTWTVIIGVIVIGAAVLLWTVALPLLRGSQ